MDLTKLVEFLQSYPFWFRLVVSLWIFLSASIPIGMLLVDRTPTHQEKASSLLPAAAAAITQMQSKPTAEHSSKKVQTNAPAAASAKTLQEDFDAYSASLEALNGLFAQQEDFNDRVKGLSVSWQGRVWKVSGITGERTQLEVSLDSPTNSSKFFLVELPASYKTQAASLQAGMLMSVDGTIRYGGKAPTVTAESLKFISR